VSEAAFVLFGLMLLLAMLGVPIAIAIGIGAAVPLLVYGIAPTDIVTQLIISSLNSWVLLAVPLFILAGTIISESSIGQRLVDLFNSLFGLLPGGLAGSAVFSCFLFGGLTGSAVAETAGVTAILGRPMTRAGYPPAFIGSLIAAAGTNANLVPPSIALLIYGIVARVSIVDLFIAGILPGLVFASVLALVAMTMAARRGYGSATQIARVPLGRAVARSAWALLAPIWLIGGIRFGIFTPTESAFFIAIYAFIIAKFVYRDMGWRDVPRIFEQAAATSVSIMFIVATASIFAWLVNVLGVPLAVAGFFRDSGLGPDGAIVAMMGVLIFAGLFLDATSILLIIVPILLPVAQSIGMNLVQFGIFVAVGINLGLVTPPIGVGLFIGAKVAGASVADASVAAIPWFLVFLALFFAVGFVPWISLAFI
jgi:C4-dicarboxylate transporter, DctM subunit